MESSSPSATFYQAEWDKGEKRNACFLKSLGKLFINSIQCTTNINWKCAINEVRPHTLLVNKVKSKVANSSWLAHWPSYLTEVCKSWETICSKINQNYWSWGDTLTDAYLVPVNCCCFYPPTLVIPCHMKEMMPDISPKSLWLNWDTQVG